MLRLYLTALIALFVATASWAQDADTNEDASAESPPAEEAPSPEEEITDDEIDELLGLDEDWSEAEDDDFNPTEEVRLEQNIAFPVDI